MKLFIFQTFEENYVTTCQWTYLEALAAAKILAKKSGVSHLIDAIPLDSTKRIV